MVSNLSYCPQRRGGVGGSELRCSVRKFECSDYILSNSRHVKVNFRLLAGGTEVLL
jgi:hypothetical protein